MAIKVIINKYGEVIPKVQVWCFFSFVFNTQLQSTPLKFKSGGVFLA